MENQDKKPTVSNPLEHVVMLQGDELTIAILKKQKANLRRDFDKNLEENMDMVGLNCVKALFLTGLYELIDREGDLTIEKDSEIHKQIKRFADQVELD
jgi:hypothetical protein